MNNRLAAALDAIDQQPAADESQSLIAAKCRGLMAGYDARWHAAGFTPLEVEQVVISDLWNPETQRKSRSFRLGGKIDAAGMSERRVIFDHKSTSEDITDPNSPYWRQLVIEGQVSHYMLLEWLNGRKVDEAVWDVMRKPGISPKLLSKADAKNVAITHQYFDREISDDSIFAMNSEKPRETLEMYEARLAHDCTVDRPEWYFQRRSVPRLDADLHEYANDLWGHSQEILHARRENRWARNSGACMLYGSPCKFLGICSGYDTPESGNWKPKQNVHVELPNLPGDGRDVLTNSRIRCFQTCRRKHFYEYELGIERNEEEEREALVFGTLWHIALEAWFNAQKGEVNGSNYSTGSPVNAVGTANTDEAPVYF